MRAMGVCRIFGRRPDRFGGIEKRIGHRFRRRDLLLAALTHPSYRAEEGEAASDNQRLEYLGDAVLGLLAAQHIFERHADADEGRMTDLRTRVINGAALAEMARGIGLGDHLRMGRGEDRAGGRGRAGMLADAFEALLGALWLDGGLRAARRLFDRTVLPRLEAQAVAADTGNPKGELQEWAQSRRLSGPAYACLAVNGPAHAPVYRVRVTVGERGAEADGPTRRGAEALAAAVLLAQLRGGAL
jgi:ribonuclease-3